MCGLNVLARRPRQIFFERMRRINVSSHVDPTAYDWLSDTLAGRVLLASYCRGLDTLRSWARVAAFVPASGRRYPHAPSALYLSGTPRFQFVGFVPVACLLLAAYTVPWKRVRIGWVFLAATAVFWIVLVSIVLNARG